MQPFKFLHKNKQPYRNGNVNEYTWNEPRRHNRITYSSVAYPDADAVLDGPMHVLLVWADRDNYTQEYRLEIYQGPVNQFIDTYMFRRNEVIVNGEFMPSIPRLHSLEYSEESGCGTWTFGDHEFTTGEEVITIHYRVYTI